MKKETENTFLQISKEQTEMLTTIVNETLAAGFIQPKTFSTVDLWNIQRRSRTIMPRRNFV